MIRLPSVPEPRSDEALDGFLDRVSALTSMPIGELFSALSLPVSARHAAALKLSTVETGRIASALGLEPERVTAMTIAGSSPWAVPTLVKSATRVQLMRAAARDWFYTSGSRFCPDCLAQSGVWRLAWRLPTAFACREHGVLLADTCARCGAWPRGEADKRFSSSRGQWDYVRDPVVCFASDVPTQRLQGVAAEPCLGRYTDVLAQRLPERLDDVQRVADRAIAGKQVTIAGLKIEGTSANLALRELTVLGRWIGGATGRSRARSWRTLPRSSAQQARELTSISSILLAPDLTEAAEALVETSRLADVAIDANYFRDRLGSAPALAPLFERALKVSGRPSTRVRRLSQGTLDLYDYGSEHVPQLFWTCMLPPALSHHVGRPSTTMIRAVASLCTARIVSDGWDEAADALKFPRAAAKQWRRYVFTNLDTNAKEEFLESVEKAAARLPSRHDVSYSGHRALVAGSGDLRDAQEGIHDPSMCLGAGPCVDRCPTPPA